MPFQKLADAGQKALKAMRSIEGQLKEKGVDLGIIGLNWEPRIDPELLPYQPLSEEAVLLSKEIPLLIGTAKNEFTPSLFTGMTFATEEAIQGFVRQLQGNNTKAYLEAAKAAYPEYQLPSDLMDIDLMFRPGAVQQANLKSGLSDGAAVYMYLFNWHSPVMDGKFKAMHCIELPFVFDNISRCEQMTGGSRQAHILADKVSQAWINFAKTGNPNHAGLPAWEPYTMQNGTTLFFNDHCHIRHHHDKVFLQLTTGGN